MARAGLVAPEIALAGAARRACMDVAEAIVEHIRSSPQTPTLTGRLRSGYRAVADGPGAAVVTATPYWKYVEFGTHEMPAEPHVRPAVEAIRAARR